MEISKKHLYWGAGIVTAIGLVTWLVKTGKISSIANNTKPNPIPDSKSDAKASFNGGTFMNSASRNYNGFRKDTYLNGAAYINTGSTNFTGASTITRSGASYVPINYNPPAPQQKLVYTTAITNKPQHCPAGSHSVKNSDGSYGCVQDTSRIKYVTEITNTPQRCPAGSHSVKNSDGSYGCVANNS